MHDVTREWSVQSKIFKVAATFLKLEIRLHAHQGLAEIFFLNDTPINPKQQQQQQQQPGAYCIKF